MVHLVLIDAARILCKCFGIWVGVFLDLISACSTFQGPRLNQSVCHKNLGTFRTWVLITAHHLLIWNLDNLCQHIGEIRRTSCLPNLGLRRGRSGQWRRSPARLHLLAAGRWLWTPKPRHGSLCWRRRSLSGTAHCGPARLPDAYSPMWYHKKSNRSPGRHRWTSLSRGCNALPH